MEERGHLAKPTGSGASFVDGVPLAGSLGGVFVGFVVGGYLLGLQPVPAGYVLVGGVVGGLLGTVWVMISPYALIEVGIYHSPWCAKWGRVASVVLCGSFYTGLFYTSYSRFWGYSDAPLFFEVVWFGSATVYFASVKRYWEFAFVFGVATCFSIPMTFYSEWELFLQHPILTLFTALFPALEWVSFLLWVGSRTSWKSSSTSVGGHKGGDQPQDP